jgi:hypothetical protein
MTVPFCFHSVRFKAALRPTKSGIRLDKSIREFVKKSAFRESLSPGSIFCA